MKARAAYDRAERIDIFVCSLCLSYSKEFAMSNVIDSIDKFGFLEVRSERSDDRHVIVLKGELDLDGVARVTEELERAEASDARQIVLDLSDLTFIDSSGVRMIVCANLRSEAGGDRLRLIRGSPGVQRVFELTGVLDRLPFEP
jgi:anti-anti-sigma factor